MSYIYDLADTWNAGGTTFTAIKMNVTDTASAAGSLLMDLQVGGSSKFKVTKAGEIVNSADLWINSNSLTNAGVFLGTGADVYFGRDAADTLAQRRGTNAQAFRVYNTFTDASNYERVSLGYSSNIAVLDVQLAGTGGNRKLLIRNQSNNVIEFSTNSLTPWQINTSGHWISPTDNTYDIGASGSARPRNLFVGGYLSIGDGITAPGAGTGQARIYVDTADGDLKIVFADGTVKTIVTDT